MIFDERRKRVNRFMIGMADIQLAYNALATDIIIIYNELSVDHYQDSLIAEVERCKKLAVFRKKQDMNYVPQEEMLEEELVEDTDNLPYEVLLTATGLPRMPRKDDMVLADGVLYSVHHVRPVNRDYKGLWELIVYPERTTFIDTLHIYKATLLSTKDLLPITDLEEYLNEVEEIEEPEPVGLGMSLGAVFNSTEGNVEPIDEPYETIDNENGEVTPQTDDDVTDEPYEPIVEPEPEPEPLPLVKEVVVDFVWGGKPELISFDKMKTWKPFKGRVKMEISEENMHPVLYVKGGMEIIQVML